MKFLVIDHHPIVRTANKILLEILVPNAEVLTASTLEEAGEMRHLEIKGIISCLLFPFESPDEVCAFYDSVFPDVPKTFLSSIDPTDPLISSLSKKGHLFLPKTTDCQTISRSLGAHFNLMGSYDIIPANEYRSLIQLAGHKALTLKQAAIMEVLVSGRSGKEAAKELGVSPDTVKRHLREVYVRLGASTRIEAVKAYLKAKAASEHLHAPTQSIC